MEVITKYICPICKQQYDKKEDANICLNSNETPQLKVGDIVEVKYGYGWFDGDKRWVINPDVDTGKHGFDETCSYGFYYVITHIDFDNHRVRYHLYTGAMTGIDGHKHGYTYIKNHYTPKLIDAPEFVKLDAIQYIGYKTDNLM